MWITNILDHTAKSVRPLCALSFFIYIVFDFRRWLFSLLLSARLFDLLDEFFFRAHFKYIVHNIFKNETETESILAIVLIYEPNEVMFSIYVCVYRNLSILCYGFN